MWKGHENSSVLRLPKVCGADVELGNFILGGDDLWVTERDASRALLRQIRGLPMSSLSADYRFGLTLPCPSTRFEHGGCRRFHSTAGGGNGGGSSYFNPQDWGRRFLPGSGGCAYEDSCHTELCLPETLDSWSHLAYWNGLLRIARRALFGANRIQPAGRRIQVLVNNSDGRGNSYGSHLNFLITRRAWDHMFLKKVHHLLFLAAYQVSSIVFTGQGKVGSENGAPPCAFQLSQRADFFETLMGAQTMTNRPIVNSRDESLCGRGPSGASECARLHVIFYDSTLAHVASLLKVGVMQIILSMIEAECVNPDLLLDDPVDAVTRYSHDPALRARAATVSGRGLSALELQFLFLEEASRFVARGGCEGIVPRADEIMLLWEDTLHKLERRDLEALSRRLDWVLKLQIIARAMAQQPGLGWNSPQIKVLDHLYSSLDDSEGLYWAYEKSGFVERVVSEEQIESSVENPPEDTRAWTRAMLLRTAKPEEVEDVDWNSMTFNIRGQSYWPTQRTLYLPHPLGHTKAAAESCFQNAGSLEEILDALESLDQECRTGGNDETGPRSEPALITH